MQSRVEAKRNEERWSGDRMSELEGRMVVSAAKNTSYAAAKT